MHIPATIAEADAHVVGGVFHESSADPQSYVDPSYFEFVKFAQMLIDAGDNASDSNFCLSIIEQTTASNRGGHFRAWVRDRPQSAELEALVEANDARAVVHKVRSLSMHARTHLLPCTRAHTCYLRIAFKYATLTAYVPRHMYLCRCSASGHS